MRPPASTSSLCPNIDGSRYFSASSARRERYDRMSGEARTRKALTRSGTIDVNAPSKSSAVRVRQLQRYSELFGSVLDRLYRGRVRGGCGIPENADPRRLRDSFLQYLQLFGSKICEEHRQPGDVAAGARQARHVPDAHEVGMGREHDRNRLGRLPGRLYLGRRRREDDIDIHADGREVRQPIDPVSPSKLNYNVLVLDIAKAA